ncbi:MAG: hypothetical protein ACERKV_10410 [Clostridiaceae bacterium]
MLFQKKLKKKREQKENLYRLKKLHKREVRYVTARDPITNIEKIIGKYGEILIENDFFSINCNEKEIFKHELTTLEGSELMSLDGIILSYYNSNNEYIEVIAYYKYYRK